MAIFDAHFHVIDPRFPLVANQGYLPEPFTVADYRERTAHLDVTGGAVVSGSFQAYDQTYLLDALEQLGEGFVGVANVPADITDHEVLALYAGGVRAYRVNLFRGGDLAQIDAAPSASPSCAAGTWRSTSTATTCRSWRRGWRSVAAARDRPPRDEQPRTAGAAGLVEAGAYVKATRLRPRSTRRRRRGAAGDRRRQPRRAAVRLRPPVHPRRRAFQDEDIELVREAAGPRALYANAAAVYR